ncbi:MAG: zinc-dependent alcohol dehydrogenase [Planctomycetota bacterium]|jgi:L-iditol 2-dehydrogenase
MLAAVLKDFENLVVEDIPKPEPGPTEAVVKVRASGLCGTDHKAVRGKRSNVEFPVILGHENSGVVDSVGTAVMNFKAGDEVIVAPIGGCGVCPHCRLGDVHFCEKSYTTGGEGAPVTLPGGFAEYMCVPESLLYRKPGNISFEAAALTEPLSCAWKAVIQYSEIRIGADCVVIGVGGIGLLCLALCVKAGAARVIGVDTSDYALSKARELGATHTFNPAECDVKAEVHRALPGGPDFVIEAAGVKTAVELALSLRRRATRVNIFGTTTPTPVEVDAGGINNLESVIEASFSTTPISMMNAVILMERGVIDPTEVVSHTFPLDKIHEAFDVMDSPERGKVLIVQ